MTPSLCESRIKRLAEVIGTWFSLKSRRICEGGKVFSEGLRFVSVGFEFEPLGLTGLAAQPVHQCEKLGDIHEATSFVSAASSPTVIGG
jgi:hypothetical protein